MELIKKEIELVKKHISESFKTQILNDDIKNFVLNGSKFIRSKLAILYFKSLDIEITPEIYNVLAATEIIHSASLLHDDIIDDALIRRGNATLGAIYSPKISILAGDYLLSLAIEHLLAINNFEILENYKNCTKEMANAEINQYLLRGKIPDIDTYLKICEGKTANLFATTLDSVAQLLGFTTEKAKHFGLIFGLCFQIKNDFETVSAQADKHNEIYTAKDILGIEKSGLLLDNYKRDLFTSLSEISDNQYKKSLEELVKLL